MIAAGFLVAGFVAIAAVVSSKMPLAPGRVIDFLAWSVHIRPQQYVAATIRCLNGASAAPSDPFEHGHPIAFGNYRP